MFLIYVTSKENTLDNGEWIELPLPPKKLYKVFSALVDKFEFGYTVTKIITKYDWLDIDISNFGTPDFFNIFALNSLIKKIAKLNEEDIIKFKKLTNEGLSISASLSCLGKPRMRYITKVYKILNVDDYIDKYNECIDMEQSTLSIVAGH